MLLFLLLSSVSALQVRSGDLTQTVGKLAEFGVGAVMWPVSIGLDAVANPWRGVPYAAGNILALVIPIKGIIKMARDVGVALDPRGLRAQDISLEINIARIPTDDLMSPNKVRAFTESFERQVLEAAKTGKDLPIYDLEGRVIGHVSPVQRFMPDAVYGVGTDVTAIRTGAQLGKLEIGKNIAKAGEVAHGELLWTSPQVAFEFGKGQGIVTAFRITAEDIIWRGDDGLWRKGDDVIKGLQQEVLQDIWEIKDNSARRDAIYKANNEGKLPEGLLVGPFKGYGIPLKFEYEAVFTKGTKLYTTKQPWYGKYASDIPTGTTYTIDPISGKATTICWFATENALKKGKGVPGLSTIYTAKAYSIFVQSLRNLSRLFPRRIVAEAGEGGVVSPFASYFSAVEKKTIQDKAKTFIERKNKLEPSEALTMLTQEESGARLMLELGKEKPPFIKPFDLKVIDSLSGLKNITVREIVKVLKEYNAQIYGSFVEYLYGLVDKPGDLDVAARNYKGLAKTIADIIEKYEGKRPDIELKPKERIGETGSIVPSMVTVKEVGSIVNLAEHLKEHSYGLRGQKPLEISGLKVEPLGNQVLNRVDALMRSGLIEDTAKITRFKDIAKLEATVQYFIKELKANGEFERAKAINDALEGFLQNYYTTQKVATTPQGIYNQVIRAVVPRHKLKV